ncbi:hypothetical protein H4R99_002143 [Coemansia sp. RSA 1722]|nr:hypothetical protein LPJ57_001140 [Coemansia sp. RSA 486]KAJ2232366.1 hypothetical protein IWW45_005027 [Coemansia sp. RSA 485]KAJ2603915.1 hypothetical protein H4R99_002143 [Coemansia sp. RSA 1722]
MDMVTSSPTPGSTLEITPEAEYESRIANLDSTPTHCTTEYFSWRQLTDLSQKMPELSDQFGHITASYMGECVALGTESGVVIVADYIGRIKAVLGNQSNRYGSVTSLSFSADCVCLAVGYSLGFVAVWDWGKQVTVSVSRPLQPGDKPGATGHPAGVAVTGVYFIGASKHRYISCSAGGGVFYHHIVRRLLTTMNTSQIASPDSSGQDGILLEATALPLGTFLCETDDMGLVAVLTSSYFAVFKTRNGVEQQFKISYQQRTSQATTSAPFLSSKDGPNIKRKYAKRPYAGCVSWLPALKYKQPATATDPSQSCFNYPQLAYSWGPVIYVLSLVVDHEVAENGSSMTASRPGPRVKFERALEWTAIEDVVFCRWISSEILLYMTQSQRVFVFETRLHQETEVCSSPPGIIAGRPWVTLATGIEAEPSYSQVVSVYKRRVFILCGTSSVYTGRLLTWIERLALLEDQGQFIDAITLATGLYQGRTGQVVVGLSRQNQNGDISQNKRKALVGSKLVDLIRSSLKHILRNELEEDLDQQLSPFSHENTDSELRAFVSVCIEACLAMNDLSILFGDIFEGYSADSARQDIFLETIEPFVLSGQIQRLPPQILNAMVDRYGSTPQLVKRLGELLMNLHLTQGEFDIDRVLSSCRRHGLWRTFARVWLGLGDPIAPVKGMLSAATAADVGDKDVSHDSEVYGNVWSEMRHDRDSEELPEVVVFDYLDMVFRGRYYPDGEPIKPQSRAEKLSTLAAELVLPPVDTSRVPSDLKQSFSTLLALADLNTERLLLTLRRILSDTFTDYISLIVRPGTATGASDAPGTVGRAAAQNSDRSLRRASQVKTIPQIVVDTIFVLTVGPKQTATPAVLNNRQNGLLSSFALTLYATRFPLIFVREDRIAEWTDLLLELDDPSTLAEREHAFELLFRLNPPSSYVEWIERVRSAGFFRVLESIYLALAQYDKALQTYLDHPDYAYHRAVFSAIKELSALRDPAVLSKIAEFVSSRVVELVETDAERFVETVDCVSSLDHTEIFAMLEETPKAQFAYLRALLDPSSESLSKSPEHHRVAATASDERAPPDIGLSEEQHIVVYPFQSLVPDASQRTNKFPQQYHERYLELMCQHNPSHVLPYVRDRVDLSPEPFRLSFVRAICHKYGVHDGLVWALVRLGDFSGALDTLLEQADRETEGVKAAIPTVDQAMEVDEPDADHEALSDADRERLVDSLDVTAQCINGCVDVCRAALMKLGRDVAAQQSAPLVTDSAASVTKAEADRARDAALRTQNDYRTMVGTQLCDLWLALLRRVLGYLHNTGQTLDNLPLGVSAVTREAWHLVSKRQRWMLHSVLDVLISAASPASSLISLRHIIQQLLISGSSNTETSASVATVGKSPGAARSLGIAEIQHLLAVAVSAYKTEAQLMALTNVLVDHDLFTTLAQLVRSQRQGWMVSTGSRSGAVGADIGNSAPKRASDGLCSCDKCGMNLFTDLRQERAMAELRRQMQRYFASSAMRVVDLHVFEDPSAQLQWIKLRIASANHEELRSNTSVANADSGDAQKKVVLFKCMHGYHRDCLASAESQSASAGGDAKNQLLLACPRCAEL